MFPAHYHERDEQLNEWKLAERLGLTIETVLYDGEVRFNLTHYHRNPDREAVPMYVPTKLLEHVTFRQIRDYLANIMEG